MAERELTAADWRGYSEAQFPQGSWSLDDDVLRALAAGPPVDLITRERFRDFTLQFEWRLPRGGNSGVLYRVDEQLERSQLRHAGSQHRLEATSLPCGPTTTTSFCPCLRDATLGA